MTKEIRVKCKKCGKENRKLKNQSKVVCQCGKVTYYITQGVAK